MAYDLHLVRTSNWLDATDAPVTKEDVDALLLSDAELAWSMDYIDMKLEGEAKRFHLIEWKGQPFFGGTRTKSGSTAQIKMRSLS